MIKYGLIGDARFYGWCRAHGEALLAGDRGLRATAVAHCVEAKARIVAADETERSGTRALLNLGHTFGHALEAATNYSDRLLHGEAVAIGMVLAAKYSAQRDEMPLDAAQQIEQTMGLFGLPSSLSALGLKHTGAEIAALMLHDKKASGGKVPLILLREIGEAFVHSESDLDDVAAFLQAELQAH